MFRIHFFSGALAVSTASIAACGSASSSPTENVGAAGHPTVVGGAGGNVTVVGGSGGVMVVGGAGGSSDGGGSSGDGGTGTGATGGTAQQGGEPSFDGWSGNDLTVIVEPSDHGAALLSAIDGAKTSLHLTMYLLSNNDIVDALVAKHKGGVDVKVVLNQTFPDTSSNQQQYDALMAGGVPVVWASSAFQFTHEKCLIVDGTTAWIMTMNMTYSSPTDNREYLVVDRNPDDVAEAEAIFQYDFVQDGSVFDVQGPLVVAPTNARQELLLLVSKATKSIDIEAETFSDSQIALSLAQKQMSGVPVRVIVASDSTPTQAEVTAWTQLKAAGVALVEVSKPHMHAKAMVVDGVAAYVGSENFTTGSLLYNRELGLIFTEPTAVQTVATTIASDFTKGVPY